MQTPEIKQIGWTTEEPMRPDITTAYVRMRLVLWIATLALIILAAFVIAPVLEASILAFLYHHWGAGLAERANARPSVLGPVVPGIVSIILLSRAWKRSIVRPWTWARPRILLFFISWTAFDCAKLALGNEPMFGPSGQSKQYYVIRSDGTVVVTDHGGLDNSGRPLQPITLDNIDWVSRMKTAGTRLPQKADPTKSPWFLPGGQAVLFWAERGDHLEFFDRPGKHPETNADLRDVTPEIRNRWEAEQRKTVDVKLHREVSALREKISNLEQTAHSAPAKSDEHRQSTVEALPTIVQPAPPIVTANPHEAPPPPITRTQTSREDTFDMDPVAPGASGNWMLEHRVPTQIPPLHRNCGTRHWQWARCPLYGLPRPRCGAPHHRLCGYFHWPSESCPTRDYSPLCQH
jgi:hypothetical protein